MSVFSEIVEMSAREMAQAKTKFLMDKVPAKHRAKIWVIDDERGWGGSILIHYRRGTRSSRDYGLHIDGADGVKEMLSLIREAQPCDCSDCQTGRGWTPASS